MESQSQTTPTSEKEQKKRKRRLRKELWLLLKRLRKACARFHQVEQWAEYAARALDIADRYADILSESDRKRLEEAVELKEHTLSAVHAACQVLEFEIERLLAMLPAAAAGGAVLGTVIKVLIGVAVVAGVAAGVMNASRPVTVRFENVHCGPIPVAEGMPSAMVGLAEAMGIHLPDRLEDDQVGNADLPVLLPAVTLDARHPPTLYLRAAGMAVPIQVANTLEDIRINGRSVLGQSERIALRAGGEVLIQVICR